MKLRDIKSTASHGIRQTGSCKSTDDPVQDKDYYLFESQLLDGEVIILCKVKSALQYLRKEYPGTVIYFPPEIAELYKLREDEDAIKKIHLVKKRFGGWIVPTNKSKGEPQ